MVHSTSSTGKRQADVLSQVSAANPVITVHLVRCERLRTRACIALRSLATYTLFEDW
jgi:hypothetical protein